MKKDLTGNQTRIAYIVFQGYFCHFRVKRHCDVIFYIVVKSAENITNAIIREHDYFQMIAVNLTFYRLI